MKKIALLIIFMMVSLGVYAQERVYEQIDYDTYKVTYYQGNSIQQTGYYTISDNNLVPHGIWKMYHNGKVSVSGKFDMGNIVWLQPTGGPKISKEEIRIKKLEHKVKRLEQLIASQP